MIHVRENGVVIGIVLLLSLIGYSEYTSKDIEELQNKANQEYKIIKKYATDLKKRYVKEREKCRPDDGNGWKETEKCKTISQINPKAVKLWDELKRLDKELKKADNDVDKIRKSLETIEQLKSIILKIEGSIK